MKYSKRLILVFCLMFSIMSLMVSFTGCGGNEQGNAENENSGKLTIVTTIFPIYDWVMNIMGERAESADVTLLLENGVDLHSFQPTASDIMKVGSCDLFICVGGESDMWVSDALDNAVNEKLTAMYLMDILSSQVKEEEIVEGMQAEEEDCDDGDEAGEDCEEPEYDEHVWLSVKDAIICCEVIRDTLSMIDPEYDNLYDSNAFEYINELKELDSEYEAAVSGAGSKTVLFGDRFPFRYLTDDYGLDYYAAFVGCSAESEASFETVSFLASKLCELNIPAVITLEGSDKKIAETIISTAKKDDDTVVLTMNSMQSVTKKDMEGGASYIGIMRENLETLKTALQ